MTGYVHLIGADDVARAGREIQAAADSLSRSIGYFEESLQRDRTNRAEQAELEHARRTEALDRFEQLVGRLEKAVGEAIKFLQDEDLTE